MNRIYIMVHTSIPIRGRRDRMVVGFTITCAISAYHHYVIEFVSDLRQVGSFLLVLQFPPPIKQITIYICN